MRRQARLLFVAVMLVVAGCSRSRNSGPVIAEGDGFSVTVEEFKKKLDEQSPAIRARLTTMGGKKEFLETLIRFELLAREARKKGIDKDPEVQDAIQKILVQRLVRDAFDEKVSPPGDADVETYYEEHLAEFVRPERIRVALVLLEAPVGSADRGVKEADAKKLLARVKVEEPENPLAFSKIARERSEDAETKTSGGDAGYRTREELSERYSPELAAAAFALKGAGQVSSVVETPKGFVLVKLLARQAGVNRSLDEVRPQIVARIRRDARASGLEEYVLKLRSSSSVEIHEDELEKVPVDTAGAAR